MYGPNNASGIIWACFHYLWPPCWVFCKLNLYIRKKLSNKKKQKKKHSFMAQKMCLALFGPIFVVAGLPVKFFVHFTYIQENLS